MKFITPLFIIALSIATFFWFINPTYKQIGVERATLTEYKAAVTRAERAMSKRNELFNRYNSFSNADLERLKKMLPDSVDTIQLIVDINSLAATFGTSIKDIKVAEATSNKANALGPDTKPYGTVSMTFTTTLPYDRYLQFLAALERSLRLTDVAGVGFQAAESDNYTYTITLKTYWLKP